MFLSATEMAKRQPRERQEHPTGPLETIDDEWKNRVRSRMSDLGLDQKDLAAKCCVSPASITNMLKPGPRQIRFRAQVYAALKWTDPDRLDEGLRRIAHNWPDLTAEQRSSILALIDSITVRQ